MPNVFPVANYETEPTALANANKTDVCTVPAGFWYDVINVRIVPSTGTAAGTATLHWYDDSAATEYVLIYQEPVEPATPFKEDFEPLHLEAADILRVTGAANQHVFVTYLRGSRAGGAPR